MNLNMTAATRIGLNGISLIGIALALYLGAAIFVPLTMSVLLASLLYPAARWLHRKARIPWFFACLSMILVLVGVHLAIVGAIGASIPQIVNKLPATETDWKEKYKDAQINLSSTAPFSIEQIMPADPERSAFYQNVKQLLSPDNLSSFLLKIAYAGLEQISNLVLILFIMLFLMLEGELLAKKVRNIFGTSDETQRKVSAALAEMAEAVRTYLVWRTIVNMGLAIVLGTVYKYVFNLDQWILWAILTALLAYVPYIGTIMAGIPPVLEAILRGEPSVALVIIVFYTMVVTFEGYIIVPWVMGRSMDLNATTVMFSCLFWHYVWGIAGLFLAMPIMAAIKAVLMHMEDWRQWGELLSSVDQPQPSARLDTIAAHAVNSDATVIMEHAHDEIPPDDRNRSNTPDPKRHPSERQT